MRATSPAETAVAKRPAPRPSSAASAKKTSLPASLCPLTAFRKDAASPPSSAHKDGLTVQQMAELSGLSEHSLRYYERAGLLSPVRRHGSSGRRRYSEADLTRIEGLACLRAVGMSLAGMKQYSRQLSAGRAAAPQQRALLEAQQTILESGLRQMQRRLEYVKGKIAYWRAVESGDDAQAAAIVQDLNERFRAELIHPPAVASPFSA